MVQASNFAHWCAGLGRYAARPRVSSRPSRVRTALCVAAPRVATASRTPQSIECPHRVVKRVMPATTGLMRPARSSTTTSCPVAAQVDRSAQSSDPAPDDDRAHESDPNPLHRQPRESSCSTRSAPSICRVRQSLLELLHSSTSPLMEVMVAPPTQIVPSSSREM
jgi:hypothetical protein